MENERLGHQRCGCLAQNKVFFRHFYTFPDYSSLFKVILGLSTSFLVYFDDFDESFHGFVPNCMCDSMHLVTTVFSRKRTANLVRPHQVMSFACTFLRMGHVRSFLVSLPINHVMSWVSNSEKLCATT